MLLEEFTEYVDSQGDVVDEGDIDWDTEGNPDAEPEEGLRHADSVVERAAFAPEWFCLNPEGAGVQVNEMYRRNAERLARGRSGESHTFRVTGKTSRPNLALHGPYTGPYVCHQKANKNRWRQHEEKSAQ